jgi:hypothetical protein
MNPDPTQPAQEQGKLPIGTRIRFIKRLDAAANEEHPDIVYAKCGETGEITGHNDFEGYMVKTDHWPAHFGAALGAEFEVVTPTHAPSEGQTGVKTIEEKCGQPAGSFAKHVAEQGETFLPLFKTKEDAETFAIEKLGERDAARATISQLEAQLATVKDLLRESRDSVQASIAEDHVSHNVTEYRKDLYERLVIAYKGTSGQALLDRLAEAEKDKALLDWLEAHPMVIGWSWTTGEDLRIFVRPDGYTNHRTFRKAIASAMRKDGHE